LKKYEWKDEFADYDESDNDNFNKEVTKTRYDKSCIERLTYLNAKRKNTLDDDNYFCADETRYAQTVSLRKRHTPAF
jgi:hypothetical protein